MWRSAVGEHARSVREALKLRRHIHLEPRVQVTACGGISEIPFLSGTSHDATTRTPTDIIPTRNPQNDSATSSCVNAGTTAGNGSTSRYPDDDVSPVVMAHTVAVFLSFDGELDTQPLIEQLWRAGKRVYLPVLHPFSAGNLLVSELPSAKRTGDEQVEDP